MLFVEEMMESPLELSADEQEDEVLFSRPKVLDETEQIPDDGVEKNGSTNEECVKEEKEMKEIVEEKTEPIEESPEESIMDTEKSKEEEKVREKDTGEIKEPKVVQPPEVENTEEPIVEERLEEAVSDHKESDQVNERVGEEKPTEETIMEREVMEPLEEEIEIEKQFNEQNPIIISDSDSDEIHYVPPEAWTGEESEEYKEEKREIMLKLVHEKRDAIMSKIKHINLLHQQIADLDKPAAQDVSRLRHKIDSCFRQIWSLERSKEEAKEAVEKSLEVQEKLQEQRIALNEKKKVTIFDFENNHLQKLKEIEEEIRLMNGE